MDISHGSTNAGKENSLSSSKGELLIKNILLQNTVFMAKWIDGKGYSVGIGDAKLTEDYETLNEALEIVGLEMYRDKDGDELLKKKGDIDYDLIARICAVLVKQFDYMKIKEEL